MEVGGDAQLEDRRALGAGDGERFDQAVGGGCGITLEHRSDAQDLGVVEAGAAAAGHLARLVQQADGRLDVTERSPSHRRRGEDRRQQHTNVDQLPHPDQPIEPGGGGGQLVLVDRLVAAGLMDVDGQELRGPGHRPEVEAMSLGERKCGVGIGSRLVERAEVGEGPRPVGVVVGHAVRPLGEGELGGHGLGHREGVGGDGPVAANEAAQPEVGGDGGRRIVREEPAPDQRRLPGPTFEVGGGRAQALIGLDEAPGEPVEHAEAGTVLDEEELRSVVHHRPQQLDHLRRPVQIGSAGVVRPQRDERPQHLVGGRPAEGQLQTPLVVGGSAEAGVALDGHGEERPRQAKSDLARGAGGPGGHGVDELDRLLQALARQGHGADAPGVVGGVLVAVQGVESPPGDVVVASQGEPVHGGLVGGVPTQDVGDAAVRLATASRAAAAPRPLVG